MEWDRFGPVSPRLALSRSATDRQNGAVGPVLGRFGAFWGPGASGSRGFCELFAYLGGFRV